MISTLLGLTSGIATTIIHTANATTGNALPWWESLLIAIIPAIVGGIFDIVIAVLRNKGYISDKDAEEITEDIHESLKKDGNTSAEDNKDEDSSK